ncbi:MAG: glycoside hydrolase family 16 protein [Capnocytophaga sp.]|nr:glycoside hydrolase family 16 protein [Capnocytophaga sp.]
MCKILLIALFFGWNLFSQTDGQWRLAWSDEFDYDGLPDPGKWSYEHGFVRNNEPQYYTKGRAENAVVRGGMLIITARKEPFRNEFYNQKGTKVRNDSVAEYTSASLHTLGKRSVLYGRIEMRAKLPQGQGVWPAFWMKGTDNFEVGWPKCGEIDIMEYVGHDPETVHGTCHFVDNKQINHQSKGGTLSGVQPFDGFHIYAIEWDEHKIDFYFDTQKYFSFDTEMAQNEKENPMQKPYYLLLNFAVGGSWGGKIDDENLPQQYLIDYVRVYEKEKLQ